MSAVGAVEGWRTGDVAPDTTWLPPVPAEIADRDSSFRQMNDAFLDRIPGILADMFREKYAEDVPRRR